MSPPPYSSLIDVCYIIKLVVCEYRLFNIYCVYTNIKSIISSQGEVLEHKYLTSYTRNQTECIRPSLNALEVITSTSFSLTKYKS